MLGPVSISLGTLVVELIIFLLTVFIMEALVFTPIRRAWAERDRQIQEGLASSSESRDEAERARREVQEILAEARRQAQGEIDQAAAAGNAVREQLVAEASARFRQLVDEARAQIAQERERSAAALENRVIDLALLAASHVTGQSFNEPNVRQLAATVVQQEGLR